MTLLSTTLEKIRLRIKENRVRFFTDADLISIMNDQYASFYSLLRLHDCRAIINTNTIVLSSATEYALDSFNGLIWGRVFMSTLEPVPAYNETLPDNFSYQAYDSGIKFRNIPSESVGQSVIVDYWRSGYRIPDSPAEDYELPWPEWDDAVFRATVVECQEIRERDNRRTAIMAQDVIDSTLAKALEKYGTIPRIMRGNFT